MNGYDPKSPTMNAQPPNEGPYDGGGKQLGEAQNAGRGSEPPVEVAPASPAPPAPDAGDASGSVEPAPQPPNQEPGESGDQHGEAQNAGHGVEGSNDAPEDVAAAQTPAEAPEPQPYTAPEPTPPALEAPKGTRKEVVAWVKEAQTPDEVKERAQLALDAEAKTDEPRVGLTRELEDLLRDDSGA